MNNKYGCQFPDTRIIAQCYKESFFAFLMQKKGHLSATHGNLLEIGFVGG